MTFHEFSKIHDRGSLIYLVSTVYFGNIPLRFRTLLITGQGAHKFF